MGFWKFFAGKALWFGFFLFVFGCASAAQIVSDPAILPCNLMAASEWMAPQRLGLLLTAMFSGLSALGTVLSLLSPNFSQKEGRALQRTVDATLEQVGHEGAATRSSVRQSETANSAKLDDIHRLLEQMLAQTRNSETAPDPQREAEKVAAGERAIVGNNQDDIAAIRKVAAGEVSEGLEILERLARMLAPKDKLGAAQKWRDVGALAYDVFPLRALSAYLSADKLDPTDFWTLIQLCRLYRFHTGDLLAAQTAAERAINTADNPRDLSVAYNEAGMVDEKLGKLEDAKGKYAGSLRFAIERLVADPANTLAKRDLSVVLDKLGGVFLAQGDFFAAKEHFENAKQQVLHILEFSPTNPQAMLDVMKMEVKLGDVAKALGRPQDAYSSYKMALEMAQMSLAVDQRNTEFLHGVYTVLNRLSPVTFELGQHDEALKYANESLRLSRLHLAANSDSAQAKRGLSISLEKVGEILFFQDRSDEAKEHFLESCGLAQELFDSGINNAQAKRDLMVALTRLGDLGGNDRDDWRRKAFTLLREMKEDGVIERNDEFTYRLFAKMLNEKV